MAWATMLNHSTSKTNVVKQFNPIHDIGSKPNLPFRLPFFLLFYVFGTDCALESDREEHKVNALS